MHFLRVQSTVNHLRLWCEVGKSSRRDRDRRSALTGVDRNHTLFIRVRADLEARRNGHIDTPSALEGAQKEMEQ